MHPPELIKSRTIKWLTGTIQQSERLLAHTPNEQSTDQGCDAHFFAIALASALYWMKKTDSINVAYGSELELFKTELAAAKDLRDMLEHDGDYVVGRGKKQSDYQVNTSANNGTLQITGLAPFTLLQSNEGLSLGGRISVNKAHELAKALLETITSAPSANSAVETTEPSHIPNS